MSATRNPTAGPGRPRSLPRLPDRSQETLPAAEPSLVEPPTLFRPRMGQEVAVPDPEQTCPHCGSSRARWVYNPLSRRGVRGWVLCRGLTCCPAADPLAHLDRPAPPAACTLSQRDLDREFVQGEIGGQTFLTFDLRLQPRLAPVFRTSAINPWESASTFRRSSGSVFDAGIREIRSAPPPRDLSLTPL
jgi:hypothetical protein